MSIKNSMLKSLAKQAEEADLQGKTKIAETLTTQITKNAHNIRHSDKMYIYSSENFQHDIESSLWDIVIRASDFYDTNFDAEDVQKIVDIYSSELITEFKNKFGKAYGAHEPIVPGEQSERATIEITE